MNKKSSWKKVPFSSDPWPLYGRPMIVWAWTRAPQEYKDLSTHGGDEDWVLFVPVGDAQPPWAWDGTNFGCCSVSEHPVEGGTVYIGAHS